METLVSLGQTLGMAGVGAGIFFLLFKEIVQKNIFPQLDQERGYQLLKIIMRYVFIFSLVIVVLATAVQVLRSGSIFAADFDFEHGETKGSFHVSFRSFESILAARAADLNTNKQTSGVRIAMNIGESFQRYNTTAAMLFENLAVLRRSPPYRSAISTNELRLAKLNVQQADTGSLAILFSKLAAVGAKEAKPEVQSRVANIGFLTGQLEELTLQFDAAEQTYTKTLSLSAKNVDAAGALATLLAERGDSTEGEKILNDAMSRLSANDHRGSSKGLALRAEMKMWRGKFAEALQDLRSADVEAANVEDMPESEFKRQAAARLNAGAGLQANMGEITRAIELIRSSIALFEGGESGTAKLNGQINLCSFLLEGGQIGRAEDLVKALEEPIAQLASGDPLRGYFFLLKANLNIRKLSVKAAETDVRNARDFFSKFASAESSRPFRLARLRCLEARLAYIEGKWLESSKAADDCLSWMPKASLARVADLIEVRYIKWKADLEAAELATLIVREPLVVDDFSNLPKQLLERAALLRELTRLAAKAEQDSTVSNSDGMDQIIAKFADLENRTGYLSEGLTDVLFLRKNGSLRGAYRISLAEKNLLRADIGARNLAL